MQAVRFLMLLGLVSLALLTQAHAAIPSVQADALRARAASQGEVRLIVQFEAPGKRFADLSTAARKSREQQIAILQANLANRVLQPGIQEITRFRTIPFMVFSADATAVDRLANQPEIISLQEDIPEYPALASSIPIIGADTAWTAGYGGAGQVIVVLDTGVDASHPYFPAPKLIAEACFSSDGLGGSRSLCPGQASSSTVPGSGKNCSADPSLCDHGTHVAGIAVGNIGIGPNIGVAKSAGLISIQVFSCTSGTNCPSFGNIGSYPSDQIRAMEHVLSLSTSNSIVAINLSIGGSLYADQSSCDADNAARKAVIDNLRAIGIATIVAAGNNNSKTSLSQPGCISSAISVGNTTDNDLVYDAAKGSNVAPFLDLLAPGTLIDSAIPSGFEGSKTGTSMSAPHVAGAWAVLREAKPDATVDEILAALRNTATSVDDQRAGGNVDDMRRINLDLALALLTLPRPEIETTPPAGSKVDLGDVAVGGSGMPVAIVVNNTGDADLVLSCEVTGEQASMFVLLQCPGPIAAAGVSGISLRCDPQDGGDLGATLEVSSNDLTDPQVEYSLTCTGLGPEIASLPVAGTELDFTAVLINTQSSTQHIQINNSGNVALSLVCNLFGDNPESYSITACPASIAAGQQANVEIRCQPLITGDLPAQLQISSNDVDESQLDFDLDCTGVAPEIGTEPVAGSLLDFATVSVDESSDPLEVVINNSGGAVLNLSCAVQGPNSAAFQVVQCPASIPAMQSTPVQVRCSPLSAGTKLAQLQINSDDEDEAEVIFGLSCLAQFKPPIIFKGGFETEID